MELVRLKAILFLVLGCFQMGLSVFRNELTRDQAALLRFFLLPVDRLLRAPFMQQKIK